MMRIFITVALAILLAAPAFAYKPELGGRAADIVGWDCTHARTAHLSDLAGKWVFIDFWASWCGPCMGELPNLLKETADLRGRDDFAIFSVSLDMPQTLEALHKVLKEKGLDYPVIYDGGGWQTVQSTEWGVRSIPATFLLDPQGNIVATNLRGETLRPALDFFLGHQGVYPPIGLRTSAKANDDGSVTIRLEARNPRHDKLNFKVDYYHVRYQWADDDPEHKKRPVSAEYIEQDQNKPEMEFFITMGQFCEAVHEITIPAVENTQSMSYYVSVMLPETDALMNGEGIWIYTNGGAKLGQ